MNTHDYLSKALAVLLILAALVASGCRNGRSARHFTLVEITGFGSNPGGLQMFTYVPSSSRSKEPMVVVMHGCTQNAQDFADHSGWPEVANQMKFLLLFPQQGVGNNLAKCFHWYRSGDSERDSGEALSIKQMVDRMKTNYPVDATRVYVTGLSAGAAMTSVMLATYPEVFAGGAMMAGIPYGCASKLSEAFTCMHSGVQKSATQWGDSVRSAAGHQGSWPVVSIWHGTADYIIAPANAHEEMEQWTNVHGLSDIPSVTDTAAGFPHQVFKTRDGKTVVEVYSITKMGHGQAIKSDQQCGSPEAFFYEVGICAAYQIAKFWAIDR
jgi:poly(hydroxyalkanoate) depolymerase family esterase